MNKLTIFILGISIAASSFLIGSKFDTKDRKENMLSEGRNQFIFGCLEAHNLILETDALNIPLESRLKLKCNFMYDNYATAFYNLSYRADWTSYSYLGRRSSAARLLKDHGFYVDFSDGCKVIK